MLTAVSQGTLSADVRGQVKNFDQASVLLRRMDWLDIMSLRNYTFFAERYPELMEPLAPLLATRGIVLGTKVNDARYSEVSTNIMLHVMQNIRASIASVYSYVQGSAALYTDVTNAIVFVSKQWEVLYGPSWPSKRVRESGAFGAWKQENARRCNSRQYVPATSVGGEVVVFCCDPFYMLAETRLNGWKPHFWAGPQRSRS